MDVVIAETKKVARGVFICDALFLLVSFLFSYLSFPLILGMLLGSGFAIFSFWLLGYAVVESLEREKAAAQRYMASQYFFRMFLTAVVVLIGIQVNFIDVWGVIPPLLFPKLTILFHQFFGKEAKKKDEWS